MSGVVSFLLWLLVLVVVVWVGVFGAAGALVARLRNGSALIGFLWGALLGPIGVIIAFFVSKPGSSGVDVLHHGADVAPRTPDRSDDYF